MDAEFPAIDDLAGVPTGDMPGDKVQITPGHVAKAQVVFPVLWSMLAETLAANPHRRAVVSVHGGSGVGKSEIGSLLAYGLNARGVGAYVMSGDNYPRRVPAVNDAERLRVYRAAAQHALADVSAHDPSVRGLVAVLQADDRDADPALVADYPWLADYQRAGRAALADYLGSSAEIDFAEVDAILAAFHDGAPTLHLKRMGRAVGERWYDDVDVRDVQVIVLEWTHGNSANLHGVDVPILLNSTPAETLAHRRARSRDKGVDSPFTRIVLELEQAKLAARVHAARIVVSRSGALEPVPSDGLGAGPMLNAYPDSLAGRLGGVVDLVTDPRVAGAFTSVYLLPSLFNTDLDRGFSVIDYGLNQLLVAPGDLDALRAAGLDLKLDFVCNHASVLSPQFQDLLAHGHDSAYASFFVDWNAFWAGHGELTPDGFVQPDAELLASMFFRKPGLPILMVRFPEGTEVPYWNTFYQEVRYPAVDASDLVTGLGLQYGRAVLLARRLNAVLADGGRPADADLTGFDDVRDAVLDRVESTRRYLGQMDLDIRSPLVWQFYADTLDTLAGYGARIVRLDAFAYAPKEPGAPNFLNDPGTWEMLARLKELADARGLTLLPEIHSRYEEGIHRVIAEKGFLTYDFFLPGLLIDAFARRDATVLKRWIAEVVERGIRTVTMLGCHDGIPLLDLKGLLDEHRIGELIDTVVARGGYVKDLHGAKNVYYQVNATYYSALGASDDRLVLARAIQVFMPGKPQVWYLDLFAGENDHAAVERAGAGGHKEINRTDLDAAAVEAGLDRPVVARQLELLRLRASHPAFGFDATCEVADTPADRLSITWRRGGSWATLDADLSAETFVVHTS